MEIRVGSFWYDYWWDNKSHQYRCGNAFGINGAGPEIVIQEAIKHNCYGLRAKSKKALLEKIDEY